MESLRLYLAMAGVSMRSQLQYRASFLMNVWAQFLLAVTEFVGVWALFQRFDQIMGWRLEDVAFLYALVSAAWAFADGAAGGFDTFAGTVKAGGFDRVLLRPRATALQIAGEQVSIRRIGKLLQALAVFTWAVHAMDVQWTCGKAALVVFAVAGGSALFYGLVVVTATICFWTTDSLEVMNIFTHGGRETAQFPIFVYDGWMRKLFTYVIPVATVTYFPAVAILGKSDPIGSSPTFQTFAPLFGIAFLGAALGFWRYGVGRYRSTGS